ncbi:hypothetical protein CRG98_012554 [Punica granatum]|uniref:CCHC-type domain-containing protein n=1 Tax=Punica granatum TaxID=22663 RepID=A0A2I0KGS3_PUNGR|nr:hypothetical protein CRG98_012554 [Punica granatum]
MGALLEAQQEVDSRRGRVPNSTAKLEEIEYDSNSEGDATLFSKEDPSDDAFLVAGGNGEPEFDEKEEIVTGNIKIGDWEVVGSSSGASRPGGSGGGISGVNHLAGGANRNTDNTNQPNRPTGSGIKCFGCGEVGHRQFECWKTAGKKTFFVDTEKDEDEDVEEAKYPEFDSEEVVNEEVVTGDTGTALLDA